MTTARRGALNALSASSPQQQRAGGVLRTDGSYRGDAAEDLAHATVVPVRCTIGAHVAVLDVVLEDVAPAPRDPAGLPDAPIFLLISSARRRTWRWRRSRGPCASRRSGDHFHNAPRARRARASSCDRRRAGWTNGTSNCSSFTQRVADDREAVHLRAVGRLTVSVSTLMKSHVVIADARPATIVHGIPPRRRRSRRA